MFANVHSFLSTPVYVTVAGPGTRGQASYTSTAGLWTLRSLLMQMNSQTYANERGLEGLLMWSGPALGSKDSEAQQTCGASPTLMFSARKADVLSTVSLGFDSEPSLSSQTTLLCTDLKFLRLPRFITVYCMVPTLKSLRWMCQDDQECETCHQNWQRGYYLSQKTACGL